MADDLEMGGVTRLPEKGVVPPGEPGSIEYAAVASIRAGADMFLVCRDEQNSWRSFEAVLREAERDRKFRRRVEESARRVRNLKKKSKALQRGFAAPTEKKVASLQKALQKFSAEIESAQPEARG